MARLEDYISQPEKVEAPVNDATTHAAAKLQDEANQRRFASENLIGDISGGIAGIVFARGKSVVADLAVGALVGAVTKVGVMALQGSESNAADDLWTGAIAGMTVPFAKAVGGRFAGGAESVLAGRVAKDSLKRMSGFAAGAGEGATLMYAGSFDTKYAMERHRGASAYEAASTAAAYGAQGGLGGVVIGGTAGIVMKGSLFSWSRYLK